MCSPFVVYLWAMHWSVMSLTSIGYGDITPQRMSEYIVCTICMLIGGFFWAYAIGNVSASLSAGDPVEEEFHEKSDRFEATVIRTQISSWKT